SDGTPQLSSGSFPTLPGTLAGLARPRAQRKYRAMSASGRAHVPWVTGCCLLVRRDCWRDLEGFAEDFFLYYDDVDLCRRASARSARRRLRRVVADHAGSLVSPVRTPEARSWSVPV